MQHQLVFQWFYWITRKATGFKFLRLKNWEINQATLKCKIEKVNINIKFYIFKLFYSGVPNRNGVGRGEVVAKLKI